MSLTVRGEVIPFGGTVGGSVLFLALIAGGVPRGQDPLPPPASSPAAEAAPRSAVETTTDPPATDGAKAARAAKSTNALEPSYRRLEDAEAVRAAWLASGLAEEIELRASAGGRRLLGVQFGGPGPIPLSGRSTILLVGGLDGVSIAGSEAVIAITDALLASPERLPTDATFVALPWANPDGLARALATGSGDGRNVRPLDDDGDGRVDEDGPDDLDGDGVILEMLIEDPEGPWVRSADDRFLRPARPGEAPRYVRTREGRDDDGDGRFNEDGPGGVALDHNFPLGWVGPWSGTPSGPWPLSEQSSRALAELARSRKTALALLFQGNHGRLASPGGVPPDGPDALALPFASDAPTYGAIVELFARTTGRPQEAPLTLAEAGRSPHPGAAIDWLYAALGALSMEVAVWGPDVDGTARNGAEAGERGADGGLEGIDPTARVAGVPAGDRDWSRWLDDTRGGLGFVEWQPVDVGDGRRAFVGGWEPRTSLNPPPDVLPRALGGLDAFVLELGKRLPRLSVELVDARREGRVALIRARIRNEGGLPSGVGPSGAGHGARLRLELPQGVALLAGEPELDLGHLPGSGSSRTYDWLVVAPKGSVFRLRVDSPWSPSSEREVQL